MDASAVIAGSRQHSIYTWGAGRDQHPLPLASAKGSWLTMADGRRLLDFNSQSMNANLGHQHPKLVAALRAQLDHMPHASPAFATEQRARVSKALVDTLPDAFDRVLWCLSGAEANENAFRAARAFTGRQKILSSYRSYHGASAGAIAATGDPRRWPNEPGPPGFIHVMGLAPYGFDFGDGDALIDQHLRYLESVIRGEGAETIAAMIVEPVVGANGVIVPPEGYLAALHQLLQRYGILLILDEVMTGFGRTGDFWALERDGLVPDLLTMAKGMTGGVIPGGAVAFHQRISEFFEEHSFDGGLTCNSHPMVLAAAEAAIEATDKALLDNVRARGLQLARGLSELAGRHPCVREHRSIGLMAMLDLQDRRGKLLANLGGDPPAMKALKSDLQQAGVYAFQRWSHLSAFPPLNISADELQFGLEGFDSALRAMDRRLGF